ncbi:MAG: folate-binding protein [Pseudomonadota bacterium]
MTSPNTPDLNLAALEDRGCLRVTGADAITFLDGLLTSSITPVAIGEAKLGGLLSPQGKVLFDFIVYRETETSALLDVSSALISGLKQRLTMYKLRSQVDIADLSDEISIAAAWSTSSNVEISADAISAFSYRDPRTSQLGLRLLTTSPDEAAAALSANITTPADYNAHRISLGVPAGGEDFTYGSAFPYDAMMDQMGGVDFEKGCYVGQEVVSRMHHRGTARKRIIMVTGTRDLPAAGTPIMIGEANIGTLGSSAGQRGLATVRLDRLRDGLEQGHSVEVDGETVTVKQPDYVDYTLETFNISPLERHRAAAAASTAAPPQSS